MAKKTVATLQKKDSAGLAKVVKAVRKENGAYTFREEMIPADQVKEYLSKK
ncbi:MAG: DUF4295 domain-containing protein [Cyclobacteriaceae bacterium]